MNQTITLPSGLQVRRRGDSIETVASNSLSVALLVAREGLEIHEGHLHEGRRLNLGVDGDHLSAEMYYILEGTLRCDLPEEPLLLGPGDHLITGEQISGATTILVALSEVRFLYVTTEPYFHQISQHLRELKALAVEVEAKDGYTAAHCQRIQTLSYITGQKLGLSQQRLRLLSLGAYLHDIGKAKIADHILKKPSALNDEEWKIIRCHPTYGRELLEHTLIRDAGPIVEQHHERLDGSGYPHGLKGDDILLEAHIVAVADTYDAMTTDRPYRAGLEPERAFAELRKHSGTLYPAHVVEAFIEAIGSHESPR